MGGFLRWKIVDGNDSLSCLMVRFFVNCLQSCV